MNAIQLSKVCVSVRPLLWGLGILVAAFGVACAIRLATQPEPVRGSEKQIKG
jgi:hypothetical protein